MAERTPSEVARETLKQLAARRLQPTPDNYLALYDEIAETRSPQPFPDGALHQILRVMPGQTPAQKRLLGQFERAVTQKDWTAIQSVLVGYANLGLSATASAPAVAEPTPVDTLPPELSELLARLIDNTLPALGEVDGQRKAHGARTHDDDGMLRGRGAVLVGRAHIAEVDGLQLGAAGAEGLGGDVSGVHVLRPLCLIDCLM